MNKNVPVRTIDNITYKITRVFSEKSSIEEIVSKVIKEDLNATKQKNKVFTDLNTHDIIINE